MRTPFVWIALFFVKSAFSQDVSTTYAKYIDTVDLRRHLSVLASDAYEGRKTGTRGQQKAAAYLQKQFREMKCDPVTGHGYFQEFKLLKRIKSGTLKLNGRTLSYPEDFGFNGLYQPLDLELESHTYIKASNLMGPGKDLKGKVLLVEIEDYQAFAAGKEAFAGIGCQAIVFVVNYYDSRYFTDYNADNLAMVEKAPMIPYLFLDKKALAGLAEGDIINPVSIRARLNKKPQYVSTENVLAFVEGSDPELKREVIVISAHYDHIGVEKGKVFNGADDNGSGTSGLLEIAQAFRQARADGKNPKRSILFLCATGEEMGLFGSSYYASNPWFPLSQTVTDLNIDMIGRATKASEKEIYSVYVIGADRLSDELHQANESANQQFSHLDLDYRYNEPNEPLNLYYRSDHYNFAKNGIPSIFYFGGFHDDYHQETDEVSKIDFEKIRQISVLVFHTAWILGNAEHRPAVNK